MDRKDFFKTGLSESAKSLYNTKIGGIFDRQLQSFANLLAPFSEPPESPEKSGPAEEGESTGRVGLPAQGEAAQRDETSGPVVPIEPPPKRRRGGFARPPGSVRDPERFKQICTECGDCIIACPYGAILRAPGIYGPVVNPNLAACALCEDYPCIQSCDERALLPIPEGFLPKFGHAMLNPQLCRNLPTPPKGATKKKEKPLSKKAAKKARPQKGPCTVCVDVCPIPEAVTLLVGAVKIPSFAHHCTGCGVCVQECPTSAIRVEYA